jgi:lipopolysaccharide export system permease protein
LIFIYGSQAALEISGDGSLVMLDQWKIAARSLLPGKIMVRQTVLELLQWFSITLTALTTFITIILVVQKAVLMGLGFSQVLVLLPFGALASLQFSVPGTVLFATCVVFGRLSSGNELTALKSLGISPLRVLLPVYILAFLLSLCSVWLNDLAVSWGDLQMRRIMIASLEDVVYGVLKSGGAYRAPRFSVVVRGVRGRTLINPTIKYVSESGADISFSSESAELSGDPEANTMNVFVANTRMETEGMDFNSPRESVIAIPLNDLSRKDQPDVRIANLAMWEIPNRAATTLRDIAKVRQTMAASAAFDMVTGDLDRLPQGIAFPARQAPRRAPAPLGQRLQLSGLRLRGRAGRDPLKKCRRDDELLLLLSADSARVLPATALRRRLGEERCHAAGDRLAGKPSSARLRRLFSPLGHAVLEDRYVPTSESTDRVGGSLAAPVSRHHLQTEPGGLRIRHGNIRPQCR